MRIRGALAILGAALALGLVGCSGSPVAGSADAKSAGGQTGQIEQVTISVSAAASLQRPFDEIALKFEASHPSIDVAPISYDGSSTLAIQIIEGAPVDVFASADERTMQTVVEAGLVARDSGSSGSSGDSGDSGASGDSAGAGPAVFATNTLMIAVPAGNPAEVSSLADLTDVVTVLCAPEVPCGDASETLLDNAGVSVTPASLEQNVTAVLQKVAAGEADAGLVYRTDVAGDDAVEGIEPAGADRVLNRYPIVALSGSDQTEAARLFVDFVLGGEGQEVLAANGFGAG